MSATDRPLRYSARVSDCVNATPGDEQADYSDCAHESEMLGSRASVLGFPGKCRRSASRTESSLTYVLVYSDLSNRHRLSLRNRSVDLWPPWFFDIGFRVTNPIRVHSHLRQSPYSQNHHQRLADYMPNTVQTLKMPVRVQETLRFLNSLFDDIDQDQEEDPVWQSTEVSC